MLGTLIMPSKAMRIWNFPLNYCFFDAIQKGVNVNILDENDQFLKLWHGDHVEYIKNANMTAKDNYITPLVMENKVVTKKLLAQAGFPVPAGQEFADKDTALRYFSQVKDKAIVVKPKSTNYGLGISIFKEPAGLASYQSALDIAFAEDDTILVEEFISGTEYRFSFLMVNAKRCFCELRLTWLVMVHTRLRNWLTLKIKIHSVATITVHHLKSLN